MRYVLVVILAAVLVHLASVAVLPHLVMSRALSGMARNAGYNSMSHQARATASSRFVVRPSPDLLYSSCPFDLDEAGLRLRVHASGMPQTYWSVSLFDAETNNFYVLDDRQAKGGGFDIIVSRDGAPGTVRAPTARGLVLIRTLIDDEKNFGAIDAARRHAACEPVRAR
jgi:uncharacterized membrane protein